IYRRLTYDPNPVERAWAWNGLGTQGWSARGNIAGANEYYRKSLVEQPDFNVALSALAQWTWEFGHWEEALDAARRSKSVSPNSTLGAITLANFTGDFGETQRAASQAVANARTPAVAGLNTGF